MPYIVNRVDDRKDDMFGVYAQVAVDLTDSLELTVAGRYDRDNYSSRQLDPVTGQTVLQLNTTGAMVDLLKATDSKFQPKVQLSRTWSHALTTYLVYSEGFRYGFFSDGARSKPESTRNYEFGVKSSFSRLTLNAAVYYTKYSDQQTTYPALPVFLVSNIPHRNIYGTELEMHWLATERIEVTGGFGLLHAGQSKQDLVNPPGGVPPETVPEFTTSLGVQFTQPLANSWEAMARADWNYQNPFPVPMRGSLYDVNAVHIVDLQLGLKRGGWAVRALAKNVFDQRYATEIADQINFFSREYNKPRSYGVESSYRF